MSDVTPTRTIRCDWLTPSGNPDDFGYGVQCDETLTHGRQMPLSMDAQKALIKWLIREPKHYCPGHKDIALLNGLGS